MTAVPQTSILPPAPEATPFARGMAFLAYFLLLGALPTLGSSALLGLVIAYARRDGSTPLIRSHHRFQIRIFWIGVALAVAALALGSAAMLSSAWDPPPPPLHIHRSPDAQTISYHSIVFHPGQDSLRAEPAAFYSWSYHSPGPGVGWRTRMEGYAAMATMAMAGLWGSGAPLWGLARLASGRPIGHSGA